MGGDWWKPHCNVYLLDHRLVSARRRRGRIQAAIDKRALLVGTRQPGRIERGFDNKFLLSNAPFLKKEEEPASEKLTAKNQDKEKQK